jgi:citrate synthase
MGCMDMIASALARACSENLSLEQTATRIIKEARQQGRRIAGLGHRVHHADPRTPVLFDLARKNGIAGQGVAFMETLEKVAAQMIKPLPINVDGALAAVLHDMEFAPVFGRLVFIIGRTAGLCAEVAEELGREKPMRIKIPVEYDGEPPRSLQ